MRIDGSLSVGRGGYWCGRVKDRNTSLIPLVFLSVEDWHCRLPWPVELTSTISQSMPHASSDNATITVCRAADRPNDTVKLGRHLAIRTVSVPYRFLTKMYLTVEVRVSALATRIVLRLGGRQPTAHQAPATNNPDAWIGWTRVHTGVLLGYARIRGVP